MLKYFPGDETILNKIEGIYVADQPSDECLETLNLTTINSYSKLEFKNKENSSLNSTIENNKKDGNSPPSLIIA